MKQLRFDFCLRTIKGDCYLIPANSTFCVTYTHVVTWNRPHFILVLSYLCWMYRSQNILHSILTYQSLLQPPHVSSANVLILECQLHQVQTYILQTTELQRL